VQQIETLSEGYALKLTIARYYTPSGRSIQAKGVEPDIIVPHKIISDEEIEKDRLIKEADLANHLEAETGGKAEDGGQGDSADGKKNKKDSMKAIKSRISPLEPEQLKKDSQVRRALDILISYEIFKTLSNG
jgi:carboxyl-terminal processing protease